MGLGEKFRKYGGPEIYNKDSSRISVDHTQQMVI